MYQNHERRKELKIGKSDKFNQVFLHLTLFHICCPESKFAEIFGYLRILTKKKHSQIKKTPALMKSMNMDIWVVGTSN